MLTIIKKCIYKFIWNAHSFELYSVGCRWTTSQWWPWCTLSMTVCSDWPNLMPWRTKRRWILNIILFDWNGSTIWLVMHQKMAKINVQFHQKMVWRVKIIHDTFLTFSASLCLRWTVWCYSCIVLEISWRRWTCSSWMSCSICWGMDFSCRRTWAPWAACSCLRSLSFALEAGLSVKLLRNTTTAKWPTEASTNPETRRCNEISIRGNQVWRFYF